MSKIFKVLLFSQIVFLIFSQSLSEHSLIEWLHLFLFVLPLLILGISLPNIRLRQTEIKSSLLSFIILLYGIFIWYAAFKGIAVIDTSAEIIFVSRKLFFDYDFQAYLFSGPLGIMIKTFIGPIILFLTFITSKKSFFSQVSLVVFWTGYLLLNLIGGGRFVLLELGLYLLTVIQLNRWKKIIFVIFLISTALVTTIIRTGELNSLASIFIGLDFAYVIGQAGESFGYFSELNFVLDIFKPMSSWSLIQYGTYLNDFLYQNFILKSSFNAYSTMFYIPYVELGLFGHFFFCLFILISSLLVKNTFFSGFFEYLMIMGLFQSPIYWYPIFYILIAVIILRSHINKHKYVNNTYSS